MSSLQLTFWDNEALETGYRHLAALELEDAKLQFKKTLEAGIGEMDSVKKLIEACDYWQLRIGFIPGKDNQSEQIELLLSAFVHFSFTPQMNAFKKSLLMHIVFLLHREEVMDIKNMETAFDLLLGNRNLQMVEDLITECINHHSENALLLYLLAQVQWRNGDRSDANNNYVRLLLYHPDKVEFNRIENDKLKELIYSHSPAMAPAFAWLHNVVSLVSIPDDIEIRNNEHGKAIACYRLLVKANKALLNNEKNLSFQFRKQLKALAPELFAEYFNWLQKQK